MNSNIIKKNSSDYSVKYSIIIPTHNSEKYILNIINEILCQTNKNFELIVVDDCSKDNTLDIVTSELEKYNYINF